jgi:hypothetical protein
MAGGIAQMVDCLPNKFKALGSIPNTERKKKKKVGNYSRILRTKNIIIAKQRSKTTNRTESN